MAVNREKFLEVFDETIGNRGEKDQELLQSYKEYAEEFLPKLQTNNFPLYGLIGEYGTGKSTFLNAVRYYDQQNSETNNIRITFEARKYPNRKELWDAFIIEILSQVISNITKEEQEKELFAVIDEIKRQMIGGEIHQDDKTESKRKKLQDGASKLLQAGGDAIISAGALQNEGSAEKIGYTGVGILTKFLGNCFSRNITELKEGISRIFDYEYFFAQHWINIIKQHDKSFDKVYIIIEDIDRCGDDGLVFIETLSYFMNTISKTDHNMDKMTCIVSIGNGFLNENRHLINKAITSYEIFNMKNNSILKYFNDIFVTKSLGFTDKQQNSLRDIFSYYLDIYGEYTRSIREIKYLLKKIIPQILYKKQLLIGENKEISDDILLSMIILNFSLFFRKNMTYDSSGNFYKENFNAREGLIYCKPYSQTQLYSSSLNGLCGLNQFGSFKVGFLNKYISNLYPNIGILSSNFEMIYFINKKIDNMSLNPISLEKHPTDDRNNKLIISNYWLLNE